MPNCRSSGCRCETGELIKNGGFEVTSTEPGFPFQYWREINAHWARIDNSPSYTNIAYEGLAAARFEASFSAVAEDKSVTLQQTVIVTPGCTYRLSFAEKLFVQGRDGTAAALPRLTARLLYIDNLGNAVDLIIVPIRKFNEDHDPDRGYTFHQAATDVPVPCDVSELIVRFEFSEKSDLGSIWYLDGVSLRAVFPMSACCDHNK